MGQIITVYPAIPAFKQTATLENSQFRLRLTWRDRTASWYADLWTLAGVPIWLGQRVSPGWGLGMGLQPENKPAGVFLVRGPNVYERENLGPSMQIVYYAEADLPDAVVVDDELTITIP